MQDWDYKRVALHEDGEKRRVSTVWLGIDHSFGDGGPPIIFETMVFGYEGWDDFQLRYATEDEAKTTHDEVVHYVLHGKNQDD